MSAQFQSGLGDPASGVTRDPRGTGGLWWWLIAALALAHFVVLVAAPMPPLHDYAGHLARIHIMNSIDQSPDLQRAYDYRWELRPNLGADLLILALARILPLEQAGRVAVALIPALTLIAVVLVRRKVFGRVDSLVMLSAPFVLGTWFGWGFLNFCFSLALALFAFRAWLGVREGQRVLRAALLLAMGLGVWTAHMVGWATLCMLVFAWELAAAAGDRRLNPGRLVSVVGAAVMASLPLAAPLAIMALNAGGGDGSLFAYPEGAWSAKIGSLPHALAFTWDRADKYCAALIAVLCAAAAGLGLVRISPGLAMAAVLIFLAFLICPPELMSAANVDVRLLTPFALVATSAITWREGMQPRRRALAAVMGLAATGVAGGRFAYTSTAIHGYQPELARNLALIEHLPQGARVFVLAVDFLSGGRPPLVYLPNMAVVRRDAFSNLQWQIDQGQPLSLTLTQGLPDFEGKSGLIFLDRGSDSSGDGLARAIRGVPLEAFDYVWIVNSHLAPVLDDPRLERIDGTERTTLYRTAPSEF